MAHHSLNSPSSFSRRRKCPASARMEKDLPNKSTVYSEEGTAAHELCELCLKNNKNAADYIGHKMGEFTHKDGTVEEFIVDGDMADAVQVYVDYCRPIMKDAEMVSIEQRYKLEFLGEDESGTSDFTAINGDTLHVVDYKHGRGVAVDAFENIQGLNYGLGAANQYDNYPWDKLKITIVQPRAWHREGPIRSWVADRIDLLDWKMDFAEVALKTEDPDAEFSVGEHCFFCKANFGCIPYTNIIEEVLRMDFQSPNSKPVNPDMLTDEEIVDMVFNKIPLIEKWCAAVKDYAQRRAEERDPLPGTKLVHTRENRVWSDPKKAEATLGNIEGAYKKTFLTAPQMEKLLGKKQFDNFMYLVEKKATGITLVPDTDDRPSARPTGSDEFDAVDIGDNTVNSKYENLFN